MYWRDYFELKVEKVTAAGARPYFEARLQLPGDFTFDELKISNFSHLPLSERERKLLAPELRKILLRLHSFNTLEFQRIGKIFCDRVLHEKEKHLRFKTTAGGVYLFMFLMREFPQGLENKIIDCTTSEIPLSVMKLLPGTMPNLRLTYRPQKDSFMDDFPGLWQDSLLLELFEIDEQAS